MTSCICSWTVWTVCGEAGRTLLPRLPIFARFGETFTSSSLFFLEPLLLLTGEVYEDNRGWRDSVCTPWVYHQQLSPMSPLSMARMSGRSLQSVWGMVPTISCCSSFSCMAKQVKLYICKRMRDTHTHEPSSTEDTLCCKREPVTPVQSWVVWVWSSTATGSQEPLGRCLQPERNPPPGPSHSRTAKVSPPLTSFSCYLRNLLWTHCHGHTSLAFFSSVTFLLFFLWASKAAVSTA